ncbi:DUF4965 domain-containing protein [bacterium]|nr:MAG: DUF4965 domain-containing protein [bacterium]
MNFICFRRAGVLLPALGVALAPQMVSAQTNFRPPSVPLIAHDPYFSVWANANSLADGPTRHWTGREHTLSSLIRVDGQTFRIMGDQPGNLPVLPQTEVQVLPTRTVYRFENPKIALSLEFLTPALPDDLDTLSRPVTFLTWRARSVDGASHSVQLYDDASGQLAVNDANSQPVAWKRQTQNGVSSLRIGSVDQPILQKKGDDLRIDWGYLYVAPTPNQRGTSMALGARDAMQSAFSTGGKLPSTDDTRQPRTPNDQMPVAAVAFDLGKVGKNVSERTAMIAYDDIDSVVYMGRRMKPFWAKNGATISSVMAQSAREFPQLQQKCVAFDTRLMNDMTRIGGSAYAKIGALAFRQTLAAHKIVQDKNGAPLIFSKENYSNGCMGTVDLIYPTHPFFALFSPTLGKAALVPMMNYAESPRWKFPFAPHDLGTYPLGNGQVYGGGERTEENQMPVEETGNILILLAQIAQQDGNAKFASKWWPLLKKWAAYLEDKGFDPESQLSTDDFAGHLAHNTNLSIKATEALGAYALLCQMRGETTEAVRVRGVAKGFADRWAKEARDGDHYKLAFDKTGTWSQKYNMVWDKLLGLNLYSPDIIKTELAYYKTRMNKFGLPLDSRADYTKLDWCVWTATMAENPADFRAIVDPMLDYFDQTPDRNPMTDWFHTNRPRQSGFQARSVVGGVFIKFLSDPTLTQQYARRDPNKNWNWAAMPTPPIINEIVPTAMTATATWRYTFEKPTGDWQSANYDATAWREGPGGLGTANTPGTMVRTVWNTQEIWARREFTLSAEAVREKAKLQLLVLHDEDADIYINGVLANTLSGYNTSYDPFPMSDSARATLKEGRNVIAVHVRQTSGGQYIDAGLATVTITDN